MGLGLNMIFGSQEWLRVSTGYELSLIDRWSVDINGNKNMNGPSLGGFFT